MAHSVAWLVTVLAVQVKMEKEDRRCWLSYFDLMQKTIPEFWLIYPTGDHRRN